MAEEQKQQQNISMEEMEYVSDKNAALLLNAPSGPSKLILAVLFFFIIFIVWAFFTDIDEAVVAQGKIETTGEIMTIQSLEGGIIESLNVKNGDSVKAGQVLLRINSEISDQKLQELKKEFLVYQVKRDRLTAMLDNKKLTYGANVKENLPLLIDKELSLYRTVLKEHQEKINFYLIEIGKAKERAATLNKNYALSLQEYERLLPYKGRNIIPETKIIDLEQEVIQVQGDITDNNLEINSLKNQFSEYKFSFKNELNTELNKVLGDIKTLEHRISQSKDVVTRTLIRAPSNGVVQNIIKTTINSVTKPAETILEIIPTDDLVAKVKIKPSDIGFIEMYQKAMVKVTSFDFTIYGGIKGRVINLSPNTLMDEDSPRGQREYYYDATLQLAKKSIGKGNNKIIPGMEVSANIITGQKRVIDYILKPIKRAKYDALKER